MANPDLEEQEEPLDPAMERIRRKMVLLQLVSGGIMFVCFMAVLAAVVYKVSQGPEAPVATNGLDVPADQPLTSSVALPAGFDVRSVSLSGSQLLFYGVVSGQQRALVFDLSVGRIVADVAVDAAP
ncbi:MAG TPA: hypothetical protein VGO22_06785 [Pseudorhizobium sp.]|nr:hypothetical protein [Pseudorhizobium sp.]